MALKSGASHLSMRQRHTDAKVSDFYEVSGQLLGPLQGPGDEQVVRLYVPMHHTPVQAQGNRAGHIGRLSQLRVAGRC